ncbi:MAG: sn-glycerol-3-phosphate ABC transporter ATP-binding protein UgpC [Armatimonadota bacterium]
MAEVILKNVNKYYQSSHPIKKSWWEFWKPSSKDANVHAVKDANIDIKDGEFMVFVGPSGCGKTTVLRMVAGLEDISDGEIFIGDRLVNDVSPRDRDIAMVFQNYALYPHMDVYENMAFGLKLRKYSKDEIDKRVNSAAELLGIQHLLHRKPKQLSGGQRQRVAMGRAIVREPKVFLMDEPLSNLDAKLRVQMRAELQQLHQRLGITTIYVTHDQMEAMTLGHRIVLIKDGIVLQVDTPLNMYESPKNKFVAGFIGSPSMNFAEGRLVKDTGGNVLFKNADFSIRIPDNFKDKLLAHLDKDVYFGLRPEDIYDKMFARDASPDNTVTAMVDIFEPMGSEAFLYLSLGKTTFVARVDPHTKATVGQNIEVVFDMRKIHIFDKETENTLLTRK